MDNSYVIDDMVVDTTSAKHVALQKLNRHATVVLTAYPFPDLWSDIYGTTINLLRGHPWTDEAKFESTFGPAGTSWDPIAPEPHRMSMLVKFLRAVYVQRQ